MCFSLLLQDNIKTFLQVSFTHSKLITYYFTDRTQQVVTFTAILAIHTEINYIHCVSNFSTVYVIYFFMYCNDYAALCNSQMMILVWREFRV